MLFFCIKLIPQFQCEMKAGSGTLILNVQVPSFYSHSYFEVKHTLSTISLQRRGDSYVEGTIRTNPYYSEFADLIGKADTTHLSESSWVPSKCWAGGEQVSIGTVPSGTTQTGWSTCCLLSHIGRDQAAVTSDLPKFSGLKQHRLYFSYPPVNITLLWRVSVHIWLTLMKSLFCWTSLVTAAARFNASAQNGYMSLLLTIHLPK